MKFGATMRPGIFMGYHFHSGGKWSRDYLVIDSDAYSTHPGRRNAHVHRVREIAQQGNIRSPIAEGILSHADPIFDEHRSLSDRAFGEPATADADEADARGGPALAPPAESEVTTGPRLPDTDYWETRGNVLVRVHVQPRTRMFCPIDAEDLPPGHIEAYDVIRETRTSLDTADECSIRDVWDGVSPQDRRPLSTFWTGETSFPLKPKPLGHGLWETKGVQVNQAQQRALGLLAD